MIKYAVKRLLHLLPIMLGITLLTFALMHTVSGDAIDKRYENGAGEASEEVKAKLRADLGLDKPFMVQYVDWLTKVVKGDFGKSYITGKEVWDTFFSKLPNTIYLTITSLVLTILFSIPLGMISAMKQNKWVDYIIRFFCILGNSLPGFFVSLLLILVFSVKLKWFLAMGGEGIKGIVLPSVTLSIAMSSKYIRQIRTVILEELGKDYVIGARMRGVKESVIYFSSVLKSSLSAILTLLTLSIGSLLGGTAIVESIFMWDGVGKLALDSILMRDNPVIQAYVIWMSFIYVILNLIADILYYMLDPRIRFEKEGV